MKKIVLLVLLMCGVAQAQPVPPIWRPPTTCSTNDLLKWNGTAWVCSAGSGISGTGTANTIVKWTGTSTIGNSSVLDDGAGDIRATKVSSVARLKVGDDADLSTNSQNGYSLLTYSDGNNYFDSKVQTGGSQYFRIGAGATTGSAITWATVTGSSGNVAFAGALTVAGVLDVDNDLTKFGAGVDGKIYVNGGTLNGEYATNGPGALYLSWTGYQAGTTQFRDLFIGDGKGVAACLVTGSTKTLNCIGGLQVNGTSVVTTANVSGTSGRVARFTGTNTVGNGVSSDDGTEIIFTQDADSWYAVGDTLNGGWSTNAASTSEINWHGYANGVTQFRNLGIYDGKAAAIATFTGSSKQVDFAGAITVAGNTTLGDASTDTTTINGTVSQVDALSALAGGYSANTITVSGTVDATAALRTIAPLSVNAIASRSAGANSVYNQAIYSTASGGQINRAFVTGDGEVSLNTASGNTCIGTTGCSTKLTVSGAGVVTGDFAVNGNTTLGDASSDATTVNGELFAKDTVGTAFSSTNTPLGVTTYDDTAQAIGVGGMVKFQAKYTNAGAIADAAQIKAMKVNGTDANYSFDLVFAARQNGNSVAEGCRLYGDTKILNCIGGLQVNGTSVNTFNTNNAIPKGNGTGLTASQLTDDGTVVGLSSSVNAYVYGSSINAGYNINATESLKLSFNGYLNSTSQFRDTIIYDGKEAAACTLTGSTKTLNCIGGLQVNGTSVNTFNTSNTIPKGNGSTLVASNLTDVSNVVTVAGGASLAVNTIYSTTGGATAVTVGAGGGLAVTNAFSVNGTATLGDATSDAHTINGSITAYDTIGTSFGSINGNGLQLVDDTALAAGVGGGLNFYGKYTSGGTYAVGAGIKMMKENATDGNNAFALAFGALPNGGSLTEYMRIRSDGGMTFNGTTGTNGDVLTVVSGLPKWQSLATSSIASGTGTSGRSTRWSGTNTVATGAFTDDGTNATITGTFGTTLTPSAATANQTGDTFLVNGTINTTSGALTSTGLSLTTSTTRSAGANNLTDVGLDVSASGAQVNYALKTKGKIKNAGSTAPTISAGCGTGATITGTDTAGIVHFGSSSLGTSCIITFNENFESTPACTIGPRTPSTTRNMVIKTLNTSTLEIQYGDAAAMIASLDVAYICVAL